MVLPLVLLMVLSLSLGAELPENCEERHPTFCFGHCRWNYQNRQCLHKNPKIEENNANANETAAEFYARKCKTHGGYTCKSSFKEDKRIYKACTDYDHDDGVGHFWCYIKEQSWLSLGISALQYSYGQCKDNQECVPKIDGDNWECQLFPNFQSKFSAYMGKSSFCGEEKHFPECDPQLPPTIRFYQGENKLGWVDMTENIDSDSNAKTISKVSKSGKNNAIMVFLIHGFKNNGSEKWLKDLKNAMHKKYGKNKNLIIGVVDWGWGAWNHLNFFTDLNPLTKSLSDENVPNNSSLYYDTRLCSLGWLFSKLSVAGVGHDEGYRKASSNTIVIGHHLAKLANKFNKRWEFHCIGHSLGAQTCGFFGQEFKNLESILGLDPAGPIFENNWGNKKLSSSDAKFVQILHTNTNHYGHLSPIGHVDFYLNGGQFQNGCNRLAAILGCSHEKAYDFLINVYKNGKKCQSKLNYDHINESKSSASKKSPKFGDLFVGSNGKNYGNYYITENDC